MTTIHGDNGKKVQFALSNTIYECNQDTYIIEPSVIICNNRKDAELMQSEICTFISQLSKIIIEDND